MREGIYVHFLNSIELRGRSPERVARSYQDGKKIADIELGEQFITIRYLSEPTRKVQVGWNNVAYVESWSADSVPLPFPLQPLVNPPPGPIVVRRMGRPPKPRPEVTDGQT